MRLWGTEGLFQVGKNYTRIVRRGNTKGRFLGKASGEHLRVVVERGTAVRTWETWHLQRGTWSGSVEGGCVFRGEKPRTINVDSLTIDSRVAGLSRHSGLTHQDHDSHQDGAYHRSL